MTQAVLDALPIEFKKFTEVINALSKLLLQRRLFPPLHPSVENALSEAFIRMEALLQKKSAVTLRVIEDQICYLNFQINIVDTQDKAIHLLRRTLSSLSVGELEFCKGTTKVELAALADILNSATLNDASVDVSEAWSRIKNIKIRHGAEIESAEEEKQEEVKVEVEKKSDPVPQNTNKEPSKLGRIVGSLLENLGKIQSAEGKQAGMKVIELIEREHGNTSTILLLHSLRKYDGYTFAHSINVAVIATAIARKLGFEEREIDRLGIAALMHDIGKLYVPRKIIHKAGRLSPREWQYIRKHPVDGEKILREEGADIVARRVTYEHHMRYDMKGYPTPKEGRPQHKASHIVRIADSYDALTTRRSYRKQISPYEAVKLIEKYRGKEFHPYYLTHFLNLLGNIPIGSVLKLDSGERVLVIDINDTEGDLPRVRVLTDSDGLPVDEKIIIDLNEKKPGSNQYLKKIIGVVDAPTRDVDVGDYLLMKD